MDATQLMVRGVVVGLFQANCYIIGSRQTGEAICFDPGDDVDEIKALARDMRVRITRIVCSHGHLDHIMAVRALREVTGAPFLLHQADLELARSLPLSAARALGREMPPPPDPDAFLTEGDDVELAGETFSVLHTPGHTPGSICLYGGGILFSGDTLFQGTIGRTDLPGGNYDEILDSLAVKLMDLPDETIVRPGHMDQTTIGAERRYNDFVSEALRRHASR
ncbi:MAG: MBL fold metallo-hydrolase [Chloroflexi bacterium]|nr:MBL fold metallo-hydrolase [Chloroflexota bacterium]